MNENTPWINSNIIGAFNDKEQPKLEDDFYANVNYEWLKNTTIDKGRSHNSTFLEVEKIMEERIKDLIVNNTDEDHNSKLVRHAYNICSNWEERNKFDYVKELRPILDRIDNIKNIKELTEYILSDECTYIGRACFLQNILRPDLKNSDYYSINILSTVLSLGNSAEYKKITSYGKRCKKYNEKMTTYILDKFGYSKERIDEVNKNRLELEGLLAPNIFTDEETSKPDILDKIYNRVTLNDLKEICNKFPIVEYLESRKVSHSNIIVLCEPLWLKRLDEIYTESNLQLLKDYLLARTANNFNAFMGEKAFRYYQECFNEFSGTNGNLSDELLFIKSTKNSYSVILSQMYINKYIDKDTKEDIITLIKRIVQEYRVMLSNNKWLSKETINKAIEKLDNLKIRAVYPDEFDNYDDLDIIENENYFEYAVRTSKYITKKDKLDLINTKVNRNKWINDILEVNAYANLLDNSIIIIAGILNDGFYNKDMSYEEKLGTIGDIIAHEISHGFDTNGSKFNKDGKMENWWKESDLNNFNKKVEKLIKYLDSIVVSEDGSNYNGTLVYKEMTADISAIKCLLQIANKTTNFDYDKFFKSYAISRRSVYTKEEMDNYIKTANHPIPMLRVNVVLQQFDKFYKTYPEIVDGTKMYLAPKDRINIW